MDLNKIKITIGWDGPNASLLFKDGRKTVQWGDFSRAEQLNIIGAFVTWGQLFAAHVKED